ncbi:40S ribosomal protein S13 [Anaeramoeba flamelloides]|uniref:40S ribosomal protein S13 n=1 Tax=Anaeramoeba flamelloides TaxID=1746091 RepID=A0AAV7YS64_9EUKA|nr:40S ribosomal protein S13 [Anaeramoeba flamelloides]
MGRMFGSGKGISCSVRPYKKTPPSWLKITPKQVIEEICKMAKKDIYFFAKKVVFFTNVKKKILRLTPSQIGIHLRDLFGVGQVKSVTSNRILRILKANGLAPKIPEDLYHLIKKAVSIRKHLEKNRKDKDAKFHLILVESKIYRISRYYKKTRQLPPNWKYSSSTASALVQ